MRDARFYICAYCYKEFEPKRRRVQKYCSNTCRSKAYHARKNNNTTLADPTKHLPPVEQQTHQSEKMNLAGIGNATAGSLLADGIKKLVTKEDNKPATKGDFKKLIEAFGYRYLPIYNLPPDVNGKIPYYDVLNNNLVYLSNADNTYR